MRLFDKAKYNIQRFAMFIEACQSANWPVLFTLVEAKQKSANSNNAAREKSSVMKAKRYNSVERVTQLVFQFYSWKITRRGLKTESVSALNKNNFLGLSE